MGFIIGLLTVVMVLDCAVLILLVLIQLPKKDAGAGLAFGGGATDALFGAGSGNVLTNITKYAATTFFVLAVVLSAMQSYYHGRTTSVFEQKLQQASPSPGMPATTAQPAPSTPSTKPAAVTTPAVENTAIPANPAPAPTPAPATTPIARA